MWYNLFMAQMVVPVFLEEIVYEVSQTCSAYFELSGAVLGWVHLGGGEYVGGGEHCQCGSGPSPQSVGSVTVGCSRNSASWWLQAIGGHFFVGELFDLGGSSFS